MDSVLGLPVCVYSWHTRSVYFGNKNWSRGVTTVIKKVFASTYRYTKLKRGHYSVGLPKRQAKRRGHAIDAALHKWAGGLSMAHSRLKEPYALIKTFEEHGWKPVCSQLVVAWPAARLATKIDLVLHDSINNKIIVVEIKSGCGYRRNSHGMLRHIVPKVSNAPLHQHQLQCLFGKKLLTCTYPQWTYADIECVLAYVSVDGTVELFMEADFAVHYTPCIETILMNTA
jgi:hypothetical protein